MSVKNKLGWLPDLPDINDFHQDHDEIAPILKQSKPLVGALASRAAVVDLRQYCSPIEDQDDLGSCTAHAGVGLVEWLQRRVFGRHLDMSRLFVYKATRNLLYHTTGATGDTGAYLRTTMKELVMIGAPPEEEYGYNIRNFDVEPPAFVYTLAENYKALRYYRIMRGALPSQLEALLVTLASGSPFIFGFTVYDNIPWGSGDGVIPMPAQRSRVLGGHAIMAVGYDDARKMFRIRNSWGVGWGSNGYGWLPYDYVNRGLADDFWTMTSAAFVDTSLFR